MKKMGDLAQRYSIGMMSTARLLRSLHRRRARHSRHRNFIAMNGTSRRCRGTKTFLTHGPGEKRLHRRSMKPGMGIKVNEEAIRPCAAGEFFTDQRPSGITVARQDMELIRV